MLHGRLDMSTQREDSRDLQVDSHAFRARGLRGRYLLRLSNNNLRLLLSYRVDEFTRVLVPRSQLRRQVATLSTNLVLERSVLFLATLALDEHLVTIVRYLYFLVLLSQEETNPAFVS